MIKPKDLSLTNNEYTRELAKLVELHRLNYGTIDLPPEGTKTLFLIKQLLTVRERSLGWFVQNFSIDYGVYTLEGEDLRRFKDCVASPRQTGLKGPKAKVCDAAAAYAFLTRRTVPPRFFYQPEDLTATSSKEDLEKRVANLESQVSYLQKALLNSQKASNHSSNGSRSSSSSNGNGNGNGLDLETKFLAKTLPLKEDFIKFSDLRQRIKWIVKACSKRSSLSMQLAWDMLYTRFADEYELDLVEECKQAKENKSIDRGTTVLTFALNVAEVGDELHNIAMKLAEEFEQASA
jgi:hypothetical protein